MEIWQLDHARQTERERQIASACDIYAIPLESISHLTKLPTQRGEVDEQTIKQIMIMYAESWRLGVKQFSAGSHSADWET